PPPRGRLLLWPWGRAVLAAVGITTRRRAVLAAVGITTRRRAVLATVGITTRRRAVLAAVGITTRGRTVLAAVGITTRGRTVLATRAAGRGRRSHGRLTAGGGLSGRVGGTGLAGVGVVRGWLTHGGPGFLLRKRVAGRLPMEEGRHSISGRGSAREQRLWASTVLTPTSRCQFQTPSI